MNTKIGALDFQHIFSNFNLPMLFLRRADGEILDINNSAAELLGISSNSTDSRSFSNFLIVEWDQFLNQLEDLHLNRECPYCMDIQMNGGESKFVEIYFSEPSQQDHENLILVMRDVTEQKIMKENLDQYGQELDLLIEAGQQLSRTLALEEIYNILYNLVSDVMDCDSLTVASYDYGSNMIRVSFINQNGQLLDPQKVRAIPLEPENNGIAREVIQSGNSMLINNYQSIVEEDKSVYYFEDDDEEIKPFLFNDLTRSAIFVPLKLQEDVVGIIQISSRCENAYSERDLHLLEGLALQIAVASNNALVYRQAQQELTVRLFTQQRLQHVSTHDPLTGLPNRDLFQDRLSQGLAHARRNESRLGILILDVDNFRAINDVFSFEYGNNVIKYLGSRIRLSLRESDTVACLGGDQFAILIDQIIRAEDVAAVAEKLMGEFKTSFEVDGKEILVTFSMGISIFPENGNDAETLLKRAEDALNRAKNMGKNTFEYFTEELSEKTQSRLSLMADLRKALDNQDFMLYYQPQVHLGTGEIIGVEALIRWKHPDLGFVSPTIFIPLAEETRWIVEIGEWVLKVACQQNADWQKAGYNPFRIAVNISEKQLVHKDFVKTIRQVLQETGLDPHFLELELTENVIFKDFYHISEVLQDLKQLGVRLAVDDFGTGYSSLSHLARFPFDVLKVDQRFAKNIFTDPKDQVIVSGIMAIARNLHIEVIAEGIEIPEQLLFFESMGCTFVQGYYFSRPVSAPKLEEILKWGKYPYS